MKVKVKFEAYSRGRKVREVVNYPDTKVSELL